MEILACVAECGSVFKVQTLRTFSLVSVAASTTLYQSPATLGGLNSPALTLITAGLVPSPFFVASMVTGRVAATPLSSAACIFSAGFVAVQS